MPVKCSKLVYWARLYPSGRVMMAQGPLCGDARSSHSISVQGEMVIQKLMHGLVVLSQTPRVMSLQSLEQREVGLNLSQPAISYRHHQCDQYLHCKNASTDTLTSLVPLHQTLHPWSNVDAPEYLWRTAQSFLITQPREVSAVSCWAGTRKSALCGTFAVSLLSGVCSSRVVVVHPAHSVCTPIQRVPSTGVMGKVSFSAELMSIMSAHLSWCI